VTRTANSRKARYARLFQRRPAALSLGLHLLMWDDHRPYLAASAIDLRFAMRFERMLRIAATRRVVATMLSGGFEARAADQKAAVKSPWTGRRPVPAQ